MFLSVGVFADLEELTFLKINVNPLCFKKTLNPDLFPHISLHFFSKTFSAGNLFRIGELQVVYFSVRIMTFKPESQNVSDLGLSFSFFMQQNQKSEKSNYERFRFHRISKKSIKKSV